MSKKMKKVNLFEKVEITDPEYATKLYEKEEQKWKIKLICTAVAGVGSVCSLATFAASRNETTILSGLIAIIWLLGIVASLVASPVNVFKVIFKCGSLGYQVVPFILIDLIGFVFGLAFGILGVAIFPVIPCLVTLYQSRQNMKYAKDFLALYQSENIANE